MYDAVLGMDILTRLNSHIAVNQSYMTCTNNDQVHHIQLSHKRLSNVSTGDNEHNTQSIYRPEIKRTVYNNQTNVDIELEPSQIEALNRLLHKHTAVFSDRPGITTVYTHSIDVIDDTKFVRRTYPIPKAFQDQVEVEIQQMLANGVIERSNSNFLNPMVIIKKKSGDIRVCLDMRNFLTSF